MIIPFDPKYLPAFVALNREWIETHFELEKMDLVQLENPDDSILKTGGEIFFFVENEEALGTCAMVPHGPGCFELAKMAVARSARGRGLGDILMNAAIVWARNRKAAKITLLSNTILKPAISLYHKHGFKTVHLGQHPDYRRSNIEMELML